MTKFSAFMDIRVYYEDTDHGGVVYYANYLKFMERARSEFLRAAGLELDMIERDFGVLFAVTETHIHYHAPALFNDVLSVESCITRLHGARISFKQSIFRKQGHKLLTEADIHLACISRNGKVSRIPASVRSILKQEIS